MPSPAQLSPAWAKVLAGRRTMLHYKPAAVAVLLQMLEADEVREGVVPFAAFEQRFETLLKDFDPLGSKQAFFPFVHLATGDGLWEFTRAGQPVTLRSQRKASRSHLLKYADGARVVSDLLAFISTPKGRSAIRTALINLLSRDPWEKSRALLTKIEPTAIASLPTPVLTLDLEIGRLYERQSEIHGRFGGQSQGGISTPAHRKVVLLFTGESGQTYGYEDGWSSDGVYLYTGEGQVGDMQFERGNKAIRDHAVDGKDLLLFKSLGKGKPVRYEGQFNCTSWEERQGPDKNGNMRKVILFHLARADQDSPSLENGFAQDLDSLTVEQLRQKAYDAAKSSAAGISAREGRRNYYARSETVKAYVLARANGICESCKQPAPFQRINGTPYLEPHHTRRVSDGGPDHPRYVGAICPTCHRRIHHGIDGMQVNEALISYLAGLEA